MGVLYDVVTRSDKASKVKKNDSSKSVASGITGTPGGEDPAADKDKDRSANRDGAESESGSGPEIDE